MADEDLAALEQQINSKAQEASEGNTPTESPTVQQPTGEVKEPTTEVATEDKGTETETAESNKGATQRIKELNQRAKVAEEKAKSLEQRLAEITQPIGLPGETQFVPQVQPGQEITPEQYTNDVAKTAKAQVDIAIAQNNAVTRINNESREVLAKYPQLNPDSDQFDKELSDTVTEATERYVRSEPYSASVSKYVDKLMKPYQRAVAAEVGQVTENIAKQVSSAALRPTNVRQPEKAASDKSIAELEQELGVVHS